MESDEEIIWWIQWKERTSGRPPEERSATVTDDSDGPQVFRTEEKYEKRYRGLYGLGGWVRSRGWETWPKTTLTRQASRCASLSKLQGHRSWKNSSSRCRHAPWSRLSTLPCRRLWKHRREGAARRCTVSRRLNADGRGGKSASGCSRTPWRVCR